MISHISIKNFAIIQNAEIDFNEGLNIITGETGSGKSIVIEAISLALGSRADTAFVRFGQEKAIVQLVAEISGDEYIITREVSATGKNLCRINGEIVTLSQVGALCRKIADIHGQYDHQSLLNPDYHISLVDMYHAEEIQPLKAAVLKHYTDFRRIRQELSSLVANSRDNERKRDFMAFELDEIKKAAIKPSEDEQLTEQIAFLQNSEKIYQSLGTAYDKTYGDSPSALEELNTAMKALSEIAPISDQLNSLSTDFADIYYKLEDISSEIRAQRDKMTFSTDELDNAIARLDVIDTLKRKFGGSIQSVLDYADNIEKQLNNIENIDTLKAQLEQDLSISENALSQACTSLTSARKTTASELEQKIIEQLKELNFNNTELSINFSVLPEGYSENGADVVEFLISTNKGEPLKPLSKIASGGEMSRIMLAFKAIIADYDNIPTMIFDEIDSGISGIAASVVGKKMHDIAKKHQIICITHLPQIAAFGTHNYMIAKETDNDATYTTILQLNSDEKVLEIARLLGGANITETTKQSARELIAASAL